MDNKEDIIAENQMELEYSDDILSEMEEYENLLFQQLPIQTNQNSSTVNHIPISSVHNYQHQNYMFQLVLFNKPMDKKERHIFQEIMHIKNEDQISQSIPNQSVDLKSEELKTEDPSKFAYSLKSLRQYQKQVNFITNCQWLDLRFQIPEVVNDCKPGFEDFLSKLRSSLISTAMVVMVYSHTKSDFALQLFKMESHNLLKLLKDSMLDPILEMLPDGFSDQLFGYLQDHQNLEENAGFSPKNISHLANTIMKNYEIIGAVKSCKEYFKKTIPKVIYYSFFVPSSMMLNGNSPNRVFDRMIMSLQGKYKCKIIVNGPFFKNLSPASRNAYFQISVFFDYFDNSWTLVNREFSRWRNSFKRRATDCQVDKVCVGYVAPNFFCCEEIRDLTRKQHLSRDVDVNFTRVIEWVKVHKVDGLLI